MFFPKLRRNAKWVFLFLAIAFALGFVGFGVGAGGVGIGDVFRGSTGDAGIPSVSEARKRVSENPKDAKAYRDLATALQAEAETAEGIDALEGYVALKPKDTDALRELAALYLVQVGEAQQDYQVVQLRNAFLGTGSAVFQSISLDGKPLEPDAISQAVSAVMSDEINAALSKAQQAAASSVEAYRKIAALTPKDPTVQLELGEAARNAGDNVTAIAAYERYLELVPTDDPTAREVGRLVKELKAGTPG
jgi:regulator of sirC expression with transglutaminase-like and TPR domain